MADFSKVQAPVVHTDDDLQIAVRKGTDANGDPEAQFYVSVTDAVWTPLADVPGINLAALRTELRKCVKYTLEQIGFTQS